MPYGARRLPTIASQNRCKLKDLSLFLKGTPMLTGYRLSPSGDWEEIIVLKVTDCGIANMHAYARKLTAALARDGIFVEWIGF
jgi:hypothetical protein